MVASPWGFYKSKIVHKALMKVARNGRITITDEGRHHKVELRNGTASFPIPLSHRDANKFIVDKLAKWLDDNNVCPKTEFLKML